MALNGWELSEGVRLKPYPKNAKCAHKGCRKELRQGEYVFYCVKQGRAIPFDSSRCRQKWLEETVVRAANRQGAQLGLF